MANNVTPDSTVYEFNAPQFLNFTTPNIDDDGADKFFDTVSEADNDCVVQSSKNCDKSSAMVSSTSDTTVCDNERSRWKNGCSTDVKDDSSNDNALSTKKEWDYISTEVSTKIQQAKATASARSVKRAFAPAFEYSDDNPESCKIVAVEIFHPGIRIQPHRKCTKVQPFSFEERHKRLLKEKEEKIKKILEEERKMREFHANPLPKFIEPSMHYPTLTCTDPKEPKLRTEERIQERNKNKTEEDKKDQHFKARPATVLQKPPFEPKKAEFPLTDVTGFHLNTEERARKREEFNALIKKKEAELEMLKLQRKKEEEKALAEEIRRMRKEAVHKANPVPVYKTVLPITSNIPLTEPKSPCFASRKLNKAHKH